MLGAIWMCVAGWPILVILIAVLALIVDAASFPNHLGNPLPIVVKTVIGVSTALPTLVLLPCAGCILVCMWRPGWAARPFFVLGCGMFRSPWPKFSELFGAGRIRHARIKDAYDQHERQRGRVCEADLGKLRYHPGSGWEWEP